MDEQILLSPSSIALFNDCPFKFYLHKVVKAEPIPARFQEVLDYGALIHEIIADYYRSLPPNVTPNEVPMHITRQVRRRGLQVVDRVERHIQSFVNFEKFRIREGWLIKGVEMELQRPPFKGIVDALFTKGGKKIVVDWKTSRNATLNNNYIVQGLVYKYLTGADEVYFVFLEWGGKKVKLPNYDMSWLEELAQKIYVALKENNFPRRKSERCEECEYQMYCIALEKKITIWDI